MKFLKKLIKINIRSRYHTGIDFHSGLRICNVEIHGSGDRRLPDDREGQGHPRNRIGAGEHRAHIPCGPRPP